MLTRMLLAEIRLIYIYKVTNNFLSIWKDKTYIEHRKKIANVELDMCKTCPKVHNSIQRLRAFYNKD